MWDDGLRARQGYLREVYPTNFLTEPHLSRSYQGRPFREYMEDNGRVAPSNFHDDVYRWDVPATRLRSVREELEPSGIVLSSLVI